MAGWYESGQSAHGQLNATGTPFTAAEADAIDRERGKGAYGPQNTVTYSGGGGVSAYSPPPPPAPVLPVFIKDTSNTFQNVKVASKDIIVFDESDINIELMQDLLFEDIAAIELANMSRYDLIDGQEVSYSPIKNLSTIKRRFDPNNIIATATKNKTSYAIDLISRTGSGEYNGVTKGVPVLSDNGEIFFYLDGLRDGEIIEIQLVGSGTIDEIGE